MEKRGGRRKEAYALGERRAKTRRSPSLMSRRTLHPSHVTLALDSAMAAASAVEYAQ